MGKIVCADGVKIGIGDTFYMWHDLSYPMCQGNYQLRAFKVENAEKIVTTNLNGKNKSTKIAISAKSTDGLTNKNCWPDDEKIVPFSMLVHIGKNEQEKIFGQKNNAYKVTLKDGSKVGLNDVVWLWRWSGTTCSLVKKKICAVKMPDVKNSFGGKSSNISVQCTYEDINWPRKEKVDSLYSSESAAKKDRPDLAKRLDVALFRAGMNQAA